MQILVCNDDGIDAPGLALLEEAARAFAGEVFVVAPDGKRSGNGGSVTLHRPYKLAPVGKQRYVCSGTAADCVVAAMNVLFADGAKPDFVLSGINDGRNVGEDVAYSGTLGIAREATFWGIPAVAFSGIKGEPFDQAARRWLADLVETLWLRRADWCLEGHFLSINLPRAVPAELRQAFFGRDKIAGHAKIIDERDGEITLVVDSSRQHISHPGDENSLLDAGFASLQRLFAFGATPLDPRAVSLLSKRR